MVKAVVSWPPWVVAVETMIPGGLALPGRRRATVRPGLIEVLLHLGAHVAVAGRGAEDDAVGRLQIIHGGDADVLLLRQHVLGVFAALQFGEVVFQFRDPAQDDFRPGHRLGPFGRGPGHFQDVAVHGIIDDQDFHGFFPYFVLVPKLHLGTNLEPKLSLGTLTVPKPSLGTRCPPRADTQVRPYKKISSPHGQDAELGQEVLHRLIQESQDRPGMQTDKQDGQGHDHQDDPFPER